MTKQEVENMIEVAIAEMAEAVLDGSYDKKAGSFELQIMRLNCYRAEIAIMANN